MQGGQKTGRADLEQVGRANVQRHTGNYCIDGQPGRRDQQPVPHQGNRGYRDELPQDGGEPVDQYDQMEPKVRLKTFREQGQADPVLESQPQSGLRWSRPTVPQG